jgi:DNA invertase Pin-like site-specific DNA recombinase
MDLIAYIRVSKVAGREGDSYQTEDQQLKAIKAIVALTPGARIVGEPFIDRDQSGGTMDRPEVKRVIERVETGKVDGVVCAYLDRWARTLEALEMIERWAGEGKIFLSARERFDPTTSQGKFALGMMLLVAKYYRDTITERWHDAATGAINRGVHTVVPYGYRRGDGNGKAYAKGGTRGAKLVPDPKAAPIVRRIFDERLAGSSVSAIAQGLNTAEIQSPRGGLWNRQSIRAILKIRTYVGEAKRGDLVNEDAHEAIVTKAEWQQVQTETRHIKRGEKKLLVGLVRCAGCGYVMGASSSAGKRWNCNRHHAELQCPSPTTAPVEGVEDIVSAAFLSRYGAVAVAGAQTVDPAVATAQTAAQRLSAEYATWRDDAEMRELIGDADYRAGLISRKRASDAADDELREAIRHSQADSLTVDPNIWASLDVADRRELVAAGVDAVVIHRAGSTHTPLAERVSVVWAGELDHDGSRRGIAGAVRNRPDRAGMLTGEDASQRLSDLVIA